LRSFITWKMTPNRADWYLILARGKNVTYKLIHQPVELLIVDYHVELLLLQFLILFRMLYWTNIYKSRPTIERSFLNGSQREILIQTDLFVPNALDLDVLEQRLYWADNLREDDYRNFHIERSFVNGSGREKIYRGMGQFIVSLTVKPITNSLEFY